MAKTLRQILTVSDLTADLKDVIETTFDDVWVEGEISNFKQDYKGHFYFTLKDRGAQISCAMWQFMRKYVFFTPQNGMKVVIHGSLDVYAPRGTYSLLAKSMRPAGEGDLHQAYEALRQKLAGEGLFDASHKQVLPAFPEHIGLVTSETGAAIRDMLTILKARYPILRVSLLPVQVQGVDAAEQIAQAIYAFNAQENPPDLLIVGRGGGSIEDLWAFNEERVARAIYHSQIPIISAIGHETDFTIADFVADLRAATPSNAATLAVPDLADLKQHLANLAYTIQYKTQLQVQQYQQQLSALTQSYTFKRPALQLSETQRKLEDLTDRLQRGITQQIQNHHHRLTVLSTQLQLLDPQTPLKRGFVQVFKNKSFISEASSLKPQDVIELHFQDGRCTAVVNPE